MKIYLYIILIVSLTLPGCKKESNPVDNGIDSSLKIAGKISNYNGESEILFYYNLFPDSTSTFTLDIKSDGSFNLNIPVPSDSTLNFYTPFNYISVINGDSSIIVDSINIGNSKLKYHRYDLMAQNKNGIVYAISLNQAKLSAQGEYAKIGDYFISYYYFNLQTTIQGYSKWRIVTADSSRELITEFSINTKVGWNKIIYTYDSDSNNKTIFKVTNIDVEKGDWIIGASDAFTPAMRRF
jgi:hypothetical protein